MGSPPPTRGTLCTYGGRTANNGITPAYAGNTYRLTLLNLRKKDHPRLRGEHVTCITLNTIDIGSPPPTRGTRFSGFLSITSLRITPAYAGNTGLEQAKKYLGGDHPRLRGEHTCYINSIDLRLGSPPPTRGTRQFSMCRNRRKVDHPRLRGEHLDARNCVDVVSGSPPPTRGTLTVYKNLSDCHRITPAYAGNTILCFTVIGSFRDHPRLRGEH